MEQPIRIGITITAARRRRYKGWHLYFSQKRRRTCFEKSQSSIFNGPVARVEGSEDKPGSLVVRNSTFGFILPHQAIEAGEYGYFQVKDNFSDGGVPLPDVIKWPEVPTMNVEASSTYEPREVPAPTRGAEKARDALREQREKWIDSLRSGEDSEQK